MKRTLGPWLFMILTCCATSRNVSEFRSWSAPVLNTLCQMYPRQYALNRTVVVNVTQPIMDFAALMAVTRVPLSPSGVQRALESESRARNAFKPQEVALAADLGCKFAAVPKPARYIDDLVIEMSGPMINPFDGSLGTFVRSSAGGRSGATWMWVRLARAGANWRVQRVLTLPVNDG
jgi:hypothetical protein